MWKKLLIRLGLLIWIALLAVFFLGLLALTVTTFYLVEAPFHLLFGWILFLWSSLSQMAVRWEMIISALIALAVAMAVLHLASRWLMARFGGSGTWTVRSTSAVAVVVMVLFAASFVATGIGHQVVWLGREKRVQHNGVGVFTQQGHKARQLVVGAQAYADEHDGHFPSTLEELAPDILDADALERLKFFQPPSRAEAEPWLYLGAGMTNDMPAHLPLVVSPRPFGNKSRYIVVRVDGTTQSVDQQEYHQLMEEWRKAMRERSAGKQNR